MKGALRVVIVALTSFLYLASVIGDVTWELGWTPFNHSRNDWLFWSSTALFGFVVINALWISVIVCVSKLEWSDLL